MASLMMSSASLLHARISNALLREASLRRGPTLARRANSRLKPLWIRAAKLPTGVEAPKEEPKLPTPLWGFTENAERWNSRAAMLGIIGLFVFELIIQKGILQLIGFEVGKGLNLPL